jgi:hypothetical protein
LLIPEDVHNDEYPFRNGRVRDEATCAPRPTPV